MEEACVQPADGTGWFALSVLLAVALVVASLLNVGLWLLLSQSWTTDRRLRDIATMTQTTMARLQAMGAERGSGGDIFNATLGSLWVLNHLGSLQGLACALDGPPSCRRWPFWSR